MEPDLGGQETILEFYRAGRHAEAYAMQLDLEGGLLRRCRGALLEAPDLGPIPLYAGGVYWPRAHPRHAVRDGAPVPEGSLSRAVLALKRLRRPPRSEGEGEAVVGYFASLLSGLLRRLLDRGVFGHRRPVFVSPLPCSKAGPLPYGLRSAAARACAGAGGAFTLRPLVYRGRGVPSAHGKPGPRGPETALRSLMPVRDPGLKGRGVVLLDDVVSSGSTLRAAAALLGAYNGALPVGLALAKTASGPGHDGSGAELL